MSPMKESLKYIDRARELGMTDAMIISPGKVITGEWVRMKCQYGCGGYGRRICCPPDTPTPERTVRMLSEYDHALLIHLKTGADRIEKTDINAVVLKLEQEIFFDGYYKAFGFGAGPCHLCEKCGEACNHPAEARPSMEACGIDVFGTVRQFGLPIDVLKDRKSESNYYGLVLIE